MTDDTAGVNLVELASELTVAWLSNPKTKISADELPALIAKIHGALASVAVPADQAEAAPEYTPAVSVRRSLASSDHLISLIDGKPYKMLKRHLALNGLTPAEYRERYGLKPDYPMVAANYAAKRAELAKKIGLGRKPAAKPAPEPKMPIKSAVKKPAAKKRAPAAAKAPAAPASPLAATENEAS